MFLKAEQRAVKHKIHV